ncbi:MAG: type II secretion system protein GspF [Robiginitomaculum sp.]|nr:MAG: type II secretion system protein GspF [Robiginitomaculum sp.]
MQAFDYEALTKNGKTSRGTVMATNARAARRDLQARNLTLLKMSEASAKRTRDQKQPHQKQPQKGKVKTRILTQATRQLAILIRAETPVAEALKITALQFEGSPMRTSLLDVRTQVLEGQRMSEAMAGDTQTYSELYRSLVASGENNGQLGQVLDRLATDLEAAQKVRRKVLGATIYPIVLSIVALAVIVILMVLVVPKVVEQFDSFNQELPRLTQMTIGASQWLQTYGLFAGIGLILCGFAGAQTLKIASVRYRFDTFMLGLPFIGRLIRDMNAARFARTMSGLLESGTPVLQAISTAKNTLKNKVMQKAADMIIEQVRGGSSVGAALKKTSVFPPLMVHMIASGEASGELGHMFEVSAEYLEGEFETATTIVLSLLEPLIIVFLGGMVLLIMGAIFLPILKLSTLAY